MTRDTGKKEIYLDHAATTGVKQEVLEEMMPYFSLRYGNPSSIYKLGRESRQAIDMARERTALALGVSPSEVFFTGSGTESLNWAIKGAAEANSSKGKHIITSNIEHHAVLHTCLYLQKKGYDVTFLPVDRNGLLTAEQVFKAIRKDTILITVMTANNEIGTIQPVAEIGAIAKEHGILFHTDAVQAIGNIPINLKTLPVDMLSLSAHKFYGPKGAGVLYLRKGSRITDILQGGGQEKGRRPGTENVPAIAGLGKAIELASQNIEKYNAHMLNLRNKLIDKVLAAIPYTRLNGDREKRLPGNANFSFEFIEGESLLLLLDMKGISASSGSACTSGSLDPSHVLLAIGLPHEIAHGSLRVTFGETNTEDDIDALTEALIFSVGKLREMSPLYENAAKNI
ncbi:MAG: cysteine desulfurase NifS [Eubacteriales bacterium]|nr:cysteine desulfurase NifS [Eubacteriales bacterium]